MVKQFNNKISNYSRVGHRWSKSEYNGRTGRKSKFLVIYLYRAEFPVHFPPSTLDTFRTDKGGGIRNCDLYCTIGGSGNTIHLRKYVQRKYFLVQEISIFAHCWDEQNVQAAQSE